MYTSESKVYDFVEQLELGEDYEKVLDGYYSNWFVIEPVSMNAQKSGIDRVWTNRTDSIRYSVEYKSDSTAATTGNVFIETVSVDVQDKKGWAKTSCAQLLVYYIPPLNTAYTIPMLSIKSLLSDWIKKYKLQSIKNKGYFTKGLLVPVTEFAKYCMRKDNIEPQEK